MLDCRSHPTDSTNVPFSNNVNYIISCRNPIESTLSFCIKPHIGSWHIPKDQLSDISIKPFRLDPNEFTSRYIEIVKWYRHISKEILSVAKIVEYNEFSKNPSESIPLILDLPQLSKHLLDRNSNAKTPGTHRDWIENWEQIENLISPLKEDSEEFIKYFLKNKSCPSFLDYFV